MDFILKSSGYIGILGKDAFDLTVYLSMVLKNLQYDVSVADISKKANFFLYQQDSCAYSYKNINFFRSDIPEAKSNIVLLLSDESSDEFNSLCESVYIVADNSYSMSEYIKKAIRRTGIISGVVFRDVTDNGITADYIIRHIIKDDYLIKLSEKGSIYQIADDDIDREYKIALGYEGITDFKRLSGDFLKTISDICGKITKKPAKLVEKALEKAKEGEIIEHSILE